MALRIVGVPVHYRECTYSERNIQRRETRRNSRENFRIRARKIRISSSSERTYLLAVSTPI